MGRKSTAVTYDDPLAHYAGAEARMREHLLDFGLLEALLDDEDDALGAGGLDRLLEFCRDLREDALAGIRLGKTPAVHPPADGGHRDADGGRKGRLFDTVFHRPTDQLLEDGGVIPSLLYHLGLGQKAGEHRQRFEVVFRKFLKLWKRNRSGRQSSGTRHEDLSQDAEDSAERLQHARVNIPFNNRATVAVDCENPDIAETRWAIAWAELCRYRQIFGLVQTVSITANFVARLEAMAPQVRRSALAALQAYADCPNALSPDRSDIWAPIVKHGWKIWLFGEIIGSNAVWDMTRSSPLNPGGPGDPSPSPRRPCRPHGPDQVRLDAALSNVAAFSRHIRQGTFSPDVDRLVEHLAILIDACATAAPLGPVCGAGQSGTGPIAYEYRDDDRGVFPFINGYRDRYPYIDPVSGAPRNLNDRILQVFLDQGGPRRLTLLPLRHATFLMLDDRTDTIDGATFIDLTRGDDGVTDDLVAALGQLGGKGERLFRFSERMS